MYLVTGGAGFIGSNLVAALAASGQEIVVSDRLDESNQYNLNKRGGLETVAPDELLPWLDSVSRKPDAIFHMGAISSTVERNVDLIMRNNYLLSLRLWERATRHQIPSSMHHRPQPMAPGNAVLMTATIPTHCSA